MAVALWHGIVGIVKGAVDGVLDFLCIHSPSRLFRDIGVNVGQGMVRGLNSQADAVHDAFGDLVAAPDVAFGMPALDVSHGYMAQAAANGTLPALGAGPAFTTNYYDHSTSSEDKQAKLQRAQTVLEATVAANIPRK